MEKLILVDKKDKVIGKDSKDNCHKGKGKLHRAFSVLVVDKNKRLLIQKRSKFKKLWPLFWTNTCCSHFTKIDKKKEQVGKRLFEEMGFSCPLKFLFKLRYEAKFNAIGSENEITYIFWGNFDGEARPNKREVTDCKWADLAELKKWMKRVPDDFTPWFKKIIKDRRLKKWIKE